MIGTIGSGASWQGLLASARLLTLAETTAVLVAGVVLSVVICWFAVSFAVRASRASSDRHRRSGVSRGPG